ncbi:MAG: restriction endonuclease subunit S [Lachnospiraceae bacterium]|nr:restriction endonuclease subunit S [Lachnospiraceae bacterium]
MRKTLGEIFEIGSGGTPSKMHPEYYGGDIPWVKTGDLKEEYLYSIEDCITEEGLKNSSARIYQSGTVLIAMYGATIGATSILKLDACTNQACAAFKPCKDVIPEYLYYFLRSKKQKFINDGIGGAQPNISAGYLKKVSIDIRTIDEQEKVVKVLDKLSRIVQKRQKEISELENLLKTRFVEFYNNSPLGEETTMEAITDRVKVGFVGTCEKFYTDDFGIPMLRTGNITDNGIDLSNLKYVTQEFHEKNKKSQIHEGDLLIARHGSNGQANVYYGPEAQCLNTVVIVPNYEIATSVFLAGLINSPFVKGQIERTLVGSTQHVVNTKSIANLAVRIPNLQVQREYETFVKQVDKSKVTVQKSLDETKKLFDSIMQEYFG